MLQFFKRKIEYKFGKEIKLASDLKYLKEAIYLETGKNIGYNTLRRLYNFLPSNNHTRSTLNILSEYIGFTSYSSFLNKSKSDDVWYEWYKLNSILNSNQLFEIDKQWLINNRSAPFYYTLITTLINTFIERKNKKALYLIFNDSLLFDLERYEFAKISTSVSKKLQTLTSHELEWITSFLMLKSFRNLVLYSFVDNDVLSSYYGFLLKKSIPIIKKNDEILFTKLILGCHDFLTNRPLKLSTNELKIPAKCHPILLGRYYSMQMVIHPLKRDDIFQDIVRVSKISNSKLELFQEFIPVLIILKEIEKIEFLFDTYYSLLLDYEHWDHIYIERYNLIALMILHLSQLKLKLIPNLFNYFNENIEFYSNDAFQKILFYIVKYHYQKKINSTKTEINYTKKKYLNCAEKIGFNYFSSSYLENYFD